MVTKIQFGKQVIFKLLNSKDTTLLKKGNDGVDFKRLFSAVTAPISYLVATISVWGKQTKSYNLRFGFRRPSCEVLKAFQLMSVFFLAFAQHFTGLFCTCLVKPHHPTICFSSSIRNLMSLHVEIVNNKEKGA